MQHAQYISGLLSDVYERNQQLTEVSYIEVGPSGRTVWGTYCLRPLEHWDVSSFFCVVLSCVYVEALRRADPPSMESYQMSK
jgi:hypothetical protein